MSNQSKVNSQVVMLCTAARGGMHSVVESYERDGVFSEWKVLLLEPHIEGSFLARMITFMKVFLYFIYLLIKGNLSLLHCHTAMRGSFWRKNIFALIARWFGIPVILHLHGSEMENFYHMQKTFGKFIIKYCLTTASKVLVLSDSWRQFIVDIAPNAKVTIMSNYVLPPIPTLIPDRTSRKSVEILFLGVIGDRKGVFDLLKAFAKIISEYPSVYLTIAGNGELERAIAEVKRLGLEANVKFPGWISGSKKNELLAAADIYILPSHNEGLPISILEAMSWQLPIISTTVGGIPELVHKEEGILVTAGDIDNLRKAIVRLVSSDETRLSMGYAARMKVNEKYSATVILPLLEEIYSHFLQRH